MSSSQVPGIPLISASERSLTIDDSPTPLSQDHLPDLPPTSSSEMNNPIEEPESRDRDLRCPIHGADDNCRDLRLGEKQREEITARLIGPVEMCVPMNHQHARTSEALRRNMLPSFFYRTFYETSVTLSSRVSKDTHVKHRERQKLKIETGNAFQAVGKVDLRRDLTKPRIERQLMWNKKRDPSSYISVFNELRPAERRANFQYASSQRVGHRVLVAEISTRGLVPATLSGTCETTWKIYTKVELGEKLISKVTSRHVNIPIWVSAHSIPEDGSSITEDDFVAANAELWMSITELRASNLKDQPHGHGRRRMMFAEGHDYEWLALGRIPEWRITRVMPWDGEKLHEYPGTQIVYSKSSPEPWIYDSNLQRWRLDPNLFAQAKYPDLYPVPDKSRKRHRIGGSDEIRYKNAAHDSEKYALSISSITTAAYCFI
ncbi:hypothetical protein SVAN01_01507 [Stagonosporopsis vannaccii]|nr:hypothetical protein SVAN01_01507 [Stagonosporopsis vannaccii]